MSGPIRPPLRVEEEDGSPSVRPVNTIKVTDGTLTDDGGATVTIDTSGGGTAAPADAEYLLAFDATIPAALTAARKLVIGGNISFYHGAGANDDVTIKAVPSETGGAVEGQIQFATSNTFDGIEEFYFDKTAGALYAGTNVTNGDASITILADGTGEPTLSLSNPTAAVSLTCDTNQKLKVVGGVNTFIFDASSATGGIQWPDGTIQTTASTGGGASAIGDLSDATTAGTQNLGLGTGAFTSGSFTANNGVAVGFNAGQDVTTGADNVLLGSYAGANLTVGQNNIAIGRNAMTGDTSSIHAIGIGSQTSEYSTGDYNISMGSYAGRWLQGDYNISIGYSANDAGGGNSGEGNVVIGNNQDLDDVTDDRQLIIAGNDGTTTTSWIKGDSTGALTINEAYTLPTAVTGTNDYVLTAQTDGSTAWAAAGGGGGLDTTPNIMQTQLPTAGSNLLQFPLFAQFGTADTTSNSVVQFNTTTAVLFPFFAPKTGDVQSITCKISVTNVDDILVSMYNSDSDNLPNTRIGDEATWDMGTSGEVTLDVSGLTDTWNLTAGSLYYLAMMLETDTTNRPTFYTYDAQDGGGHNTNLPTNDTTTATYQPGNSVLKLSSLSAALPSSITTSDLTGHRPPFYRVPVVGVVM